MQPHPVRLVLTDDLRRSRLTVFFRLLLAIPHFIWLFLWTVLALVLTVVNWIATLATGRSPDALHRFLGAYVRYATHLSAYLYLAANPFPAFEGAPGTYPVDLEIDPPAPQRRWVTALRLPLALPALLIFFALDGGPGGGGQTRSNDSGTDVGFFFGGLGLAPTVAFLGWFACLALGRMPQGFRNAAVFSLRYGAQVFAYLLLLTDRYPSPDPTLPASAGAPPPRTVRVLVEEDLRRSRLTVFFRLLLALPHLVWLTLWAVLALFAAIASWVAALVTGRVPDALFRFLSAFVRYDAHVTAFLGLIANPFPGFLGRPRSYPVDVEIDGPERQHRLVTGFRLPLAIPGLMASSALGGVLFAAAFLGWFASLAIGRIPASLQRLGAWSIRYTAELYGYLLLLTDRYPYSSPRVEAPEPEADAAVSPLAA